MKTLKIILKAVNKVLFVFFICITIYTFFTNRLNLLIGLCILPLIMVPYLLDRIKVYHMDEVLVFFYYLLILLSLFFGSILKFYYKIWWFDLLVHFISGILSSIVAFIIIKENKLINNKYKWFNFIFIIIFTISVAACWEYGEFFCDKIFKTDSQWVFNSGVDDTMTDMLIATLSGILSSCYYLFYIKKNKDGCYEKR